MLNKILYRIIRGRYLLIVGDLFIRFSEPDSDLIFDSYQVYEDAYDLAYGGECYTDTELNNLLIEADIWSPNHDKALDEKSKKLDELKLQAFQNFLNVKILRRIKANIKFIELEIEDLLKRKHSLDSLSCHGVAENARLRWLVSKCVKTDKVIDSQRLLDAYQASSLSSNEIRSVAKMNQWKNIWIASKNIDLFGKPAVDLSSDQLTLISYSKMYDNVYEHPERPNEKVIEDDDCLDGWFIHQHKKIEKQKNEKEMEGVIRNPKIKNAGEIFVMADSKESASKVYDLNTGYNRRVIQERHDVIQEKGKVKQMDFLDAKRDIEIQKTDILRKHLKGIGK